MGWVDVDVISEPRNITGGVIDRRLNSYYPVLRQAHADGGAQHVLIENVYNIYDMTNRILSAIGSNSIRRLRIFGHGSKDLVQMGPFQYTGRGTDALEEQNHIDENDTDKILKAVISPDGNTLYNQKHLEKLQGHFAPNAWVELHACNVMSDNGGILIQSLSDLWNRAIQASDEPQVVGGGLEGTIWQAKPGQRPVIIRRPEPVPGSSSAGEQMQSWNHPLRSIMNTLDPSTPNQSITKIPQAGVTMFHPIRLAGFVDYSKPVTAPGFHTTIGTNTTLTTFHAKHDPIRATIDGLGAGTVSVHPMVPGTEYSDIGTGRSYRINNYGYPRDTGFSWGGTNTEGLGATRQSLLHWNHPLGQTMQRLSPGWTSGSSMIPGTGFSDISTGRSYTVNSFGRPMDTGMNWGGRTRQSFSSDFLALRASTNPVNAALRQLGG